MAERFEGFDLGRDGPSEEVVGEVEDDEVGEGGEERGRDGSGEVVVREGEALEGCEGGQLGGEVAGERLVWEGELGDAVVGGGAEDARPPARGWVGVGPGGEGPRRVGVHGGLQG